MIIELKGQYPPLKPINKIKNDHLVYLNFENYLWITNYTTNDYNSFI